MNKQHANLIIISTVFLLFFIFGYLLAVSEQQETITKHCENIIEQEFIGQFESIEECIIELTR